MENTPSHWPLLLTSCHVLSSFLFSKEPLSIALKVQNSSSSFWCITFWLLCPFQITFSSFMTHQQGISSKACNLSAHRLRRLAKPNPTCLAPAWTLRYYFSTSLTSLVILPDSQGICICVYCRKFKPTDCWKCHIRWPQLYKSISWSAIYSAEYNLKCKINKMDLYCSHTL